MVKEQVGPARPTKTPPSLRLQAGQTPVEAHKNKVTR